MLNIMHEYYLLFLYPLNCKPAIPCNETKKIIKYYPPRSNIVKKLFLKSLLSDKSTKKRSQMNGF